ncbi:MAG: hypothetical protein ACREAO_05510 [Nitrososphaera sp.]
MLFRKDATIRERATVALANLQRNAYAMSMLRGRLESRINFILSDGGKGGEYQEMARVLELVKNSELILNELSGKVESARFLEEFITIIDSAAASVSGIKGDVENLVPIAENALLEMHDAIAKISTGLYGEPVQQILDEAAAVPAVEAQVIEQTPPAVIPAQEATEEEERQAELA